MKNEPTPPPNAKTGSFQEFKEFTRGVLRGARKIDPTEPRIWVQSAHPSTKTRT